MMIRPHFNALKKGSVKGLWQADLKVKHAACRDIRQSRGGHAGESVQVAGQNLDCASDDLTEKASPRRSRRPPASSAYGVVQPDSSRRCVMKDLNAMIEFFETTGYDSDIAAFKAVVPDARDARRGSARREVLVRGRPRRPGSVSSSCLFLAFLAAPRSRLDGVAALRYN